VANEVVVAVCTNRPPEAIDEALAALAAQVPEGRLAIVASATPPAAYGERFGGTVLSEPRPGLSRARNHALEWAPADGVVAFVDDDAVIGPGWYDALSAAWSEASPDVGAIGGPIRPRWASGPPAWVSEPLLPALTLLDLGGERRELDVSVTTVYGANISFRVEPLRRAGGFDPAFGHSGARVFFAEEDEAQRALARLGFRTLYEPGAAVEHLIPASRLTRGSFVRRRFAYGRALRRRGGRGRGLALRQALSSGAGAVVALARRDDRLFMERLVRAAENAGVLAG
jgi:GT2 family glycosyltransferase